MMKEFMGGGSITDVCFGITGDFAFISESIGVIRTYQFQPNKGVYTRILTTKVGTENKSINSIEYKGWYLRKLFIAELLVSSSDGKIYLYGVDNLGNLTLKRDIKNDCSKNKIRAHFCPLIPTDKDGACIVSGSEDMSLYIYDITKPNAPPINQLMGHSAPVIDVAWNYDESLLGSCDSDGTVIFWLRSK